MTKRLNLNKDEFKGKFRQRNWKRKRDKKYMKKSIIIIKDPFKGNLYQRLCIYYLSN